MSKNSNDLIIDNLPNRLTLFRIFLIPIILTGLYLQLPEFQWTNSTYSLLGVLAAITFAIASMTDYVDGYLARKKNIVTVFGSFLDPTADKFLTVSSLIMLQALERIHVLIVIFLVLREIYITSLRLLASTEGVSVPVNRGGKWKTATLMVGIPLLMMDLGVKQFPHLLIGKILIYIASILSFFSCIQYSLGLIGKLKESRKNKNRR